MKTYKTWEMIKELTENPNKIFKNQYGEEIRVLPDNDLFFEGENGYNFISITDEWEEVKEPVTFMEAINIGKCIKPATWDTDYWDLSLLMHALSDYDDEDIREIINGEWYIED